jgi:fumarylpyruvate hydrolase
MTFVLDPPIVPSVAVAEGEARLPIRRIFCVGRNYADHAREMGKDPNREAPFFFTKPADAVVDSGETIPYPPETRNFHYEAEFVAVIGRRGRNIAESEARSFVWGYAVGNDLTRRDLQLEARDKGRPWDLGKAFDRSAVIGPVYAASKIGHPERGSITLAVNGALKQSGDLSEMIWSTPEIISILSRYVELAPGDLIMTGTPAGVGPLVKGDTCIVSIQGLGQIVSKIGPGS